MSNSLIHCRGLSVNQGSSLILSDIHLEILSGQSLGIVGTNGAGKTTLLRSIAGLVPNAKGEISIQNHNPLSTSPRILSQLFAYLPQNPFCTWDFTVRDLSELSAYPEKYLDWIHRLKIGEKIESRLSQLSGGEKKLAHLSLVFSALGNPSQKVLLLDEPTAALDYERGQLVSDAIQDFIRQGAAVLCTTHDLALAQSCQEILVLNQGRLMNKISSKNIPTTELIKIIGNK